MFAMKLVIDITSSEHQIIISWSFRLQLVILRLQNVTSYTSSFKNVVQGRLRKITILTLELYLLDYYVWVYTYEFQNF